VCCSMASSNQREIPDLLAPVALQVVLNMALDGKLQSAVTQTLLDHADEINQNFDTWIAEVEGLSSRGN
jgi:hypothetical protein